MTAGTARRLGLPALLALVCAGCVPAAGTDQGREFGSMWTVFTWGGVIVSGLVAVLTTWAVLRYRRRDDRLPPQTSGNTMLEIAWTVAPLITVVGLFILTFRSFTIVGPAEARPGDVSLDVDAYRWGWSFTYPGTDVTVTSQPGEAPVVVLPVGRTVHVTLTSRDVIHAFFVPGFLFKRDAIPGRTTTFDMTISQPGDYGGVCAEYCGVFHDQMPFTIRGVASADFDVWLLAPSTPPTLPAATPSAPVAAPVAAPSGSGG